MGFLKKYLNSCDCVEENYETIAYLANLDSLLKSNPVIGNAVLNELLAQRSSLKLIASENYSSLKVQLAMGNLLTDKYAEGHPFHRFYAGCENVDSVESQAVKLAKALFGADHAYAQPHSGADANLVAFWSILVKRIETPGIENLGKKSINELTDDEYESIRKRFAEQKMVGMALDSGGHLTHGSRVNVSSKMFRAISYGVDPKTHLIDYKLVEQIVKREKPAVLLAGYSAYPRLIDFSIMKEIAHKYGATFMTDMAHFAGLVAGKALTGNYNPIPFSDIVTSTTHKTLRGPRGGLILCKEEYREFIDKGCPFVLGGPLPHIIAAKAVALQEASEPNFQTYAKQILSNAKMLAETFLKKGVKLITGGTDNHLVLVDVQSSFGITGRQAETALSSVGITLNRNSIPSDPNGPWYTSGIRLGSPALTTRGMKQREMAKIADLIYDLLKHTQAAFDPTTGKPSKAKVMVDEKVSNRVKSEVKELLGDFPLYPEILLYAEELNMCSRS